MNYYKMNFDGVTAIIVQHREDLFYVLDTIKRHDYFIAHNGTVWNLKQFQTLNQIKNPSEREKLLAQDSKGFC